jgi:hypothetical protein
MTNAIEHVSRHRVENTVLQVMADMPGDVDRLVREEEAVIRHYVRLGNWPHSRVNMFVLEDLQPLVLQIKGATALSTVVANDIDRRPMVNVYDADDLSECAVFVNRGALEHDGLWDDDVALRGLLAHEHGHPLAENATVHAARALSVKATVEGPMAKTIAPVIDLLADRMCVHAPQEVFANEMAVRAGFGNALFHLDRKIVDKAKLGVNWRSSLAQNLEQRVVARKLSAEQAATLLLIGDLQAHLVFALEIAPFLRAERRHEAEALEAALIEGVLSHVDPAALPIYEQCRDHYLSLRTDLSADETKKWITEALDILSGGLRRGHLQVRFALTSRATSRRQRRPRPAAAALACGAVGHDEGVA